MANKNIILRGRRISHLAPYVIAEIGSNHACSLGTALESIDAAAECGADAVKFQSLNVEEQYFDPSEAIRSLHKKIDLDEKWYATLAERCSQKNVDFLSSPTYIRSITLLEAVKVPAYKLASAQIGTYPQLVREVAKTGKPVFFSTGIVDIAGINKAVKIFEEEKNPNYIILHCSSIYPLPFERVNLPQIGKYASLFDCLTGYSDHTEGPFISAAAIAHGAAVIEKHFTLSKTLDSPDAPLSTEPEEFRQMVAGIRAVALAQNEMTRISIEPEEAGFLKRIEEKLITSREIPAGQSPGAESFIHKRAPGGINAEYEPLVISQMIAQRTIPKNTLVTWEDFKGSKL
jgi:sialic acid synthase SpsE